MRKTIKISLIALCLFTLCFTMPSAKSFAESRFPDMNGHWAEKQVEALAEKGIIKGMGDGLFHPGEPVTVSQFIEMIMRSVFRDVAPTGAHWASGYIDKALSLGVIEEDDVALPDAPLPRRTAARISYMTLLNVLNEPAEEDVSVARRLQDLESCRSCIEPVTQVYTKGIMIGRPDSNFYGDDTITRAEAAVVIMRVLDPAVRLPQSDGAVKPEPQGNDTVPAEPKKIDTITPDEVLKVLETDKNALIIDVRPEENHKAGFIKGSICIPLDTIDELISTVASDKDTLIILYCQKGSRSALAYEKLKEAGYTNVRSLGGIEDWPYEVSVSK